MIPLSMLPDRLTYQAQGPDLGEGPTAGPELVWRARVQTKMKLIAYADGRTANATDLIIGYPQGFDDRGARQTLTPQLEDVVSGSPLWGAYGQRRVMAVETFRGLAGNIHHHEVWVGLA